MDKPLRSKYLKQNSCFFLIKRLIQQCVVAFESNEDHTNNGLQLKALYHTEQQTIEGANMIHCNCRQFKQEIEYILHLLKHIYKRHILNNRLLTKDRCIQMQRI